MINSCFSSGKGFYIFDYDTRATNNGFKHEVASGFETTKCALSVSAIHASTNIIGDHYDSIPNIYVADYNQSTGTFPKFFVSSNNYAHDMNYIEGTVLIIATAWNPPYNIEIHITT
jgi:hypothetical protein